ncbi:hypothetical protein [Acinetobacter sp. ULE_I037]|uniref:hypothetical protein n=1 Tax=unclassified Acinetobacter TaxID=196816 RepID=UPI003AF8E23D
MKKILLILICISYSHFANAQTQNYILVNGGGIDDNGLLLKNIQGKTIYANCNQKCGQWFDHDEETSGQILKKEYIEKKIQADIQFEKNADRVMGPSADESFYFINQIKFIE